MLTSKEKSDTKRLPMMPIREVVIFPYMMTPFVVGRESSVRALEEAMSGDKKIFLAAQHDATVDAPEPNEIYSVGTIVNIVQSLRLPDGNIKVLVEGVERAKVVSVSDDEGFFRAIVRTANYKIETGPQLDALISRVTGPSTADPTGNRCGTSAQGSPSACFSPREIRFSPGLTERITASTVSPGLSISLGFRTFFTHDISDTWIRPSIPGSSSTNAPKSIKRVTVPVTRWATLYLSAAESHGSASSCFRPSEIRLLSGSTLRTFS